jgi:hypothetical protein
MELPEGLILFERTETDCLSKEALEQMQQRRLESVSRAAYCTRVLALLVIPVYNDAPRHLIRSLQSLLSSTKTMPAAVIFCFGYSNICRPPRRLHPP